MGRPDWEYDWQDDAGELLDDRRLRLGWLGSGEQFVYEFDFGDWWMHLCTVGSQRIDPLEVLGVLPDRPMPYWGWGDIPDQYARRWDGDDGEFEGPRPDRQLRDLPPVRPRWGRSMR